MHQPVRSVPARRSVSLPVWIEIAETQARAVNPYTQWVAAVRRRLRAAQPHHPAPVSGEAGGVMEVVASV